ncbi:MAG: Fe-S cluster assembly sulfur transfer protein SufU [Candidatus Eisenbacteria bacterium]
MSDLRELYQEVIIDHSKKPRNFRRPDGFNRKAEGYNPLCGDRFTVYLKLEEGVIRDIGFEGSGCAISTASASMMTEDIKGKPREMAHQVFHRFHDLVTGDPAAAATEPLGLGKLAAFAGVREFPVRVKCATLAWHTLEAALEGKDEAITTE